MENSNYIQQPNVDKEGNLQHHMPAVPEGMRCERSGCKSKVGKDYKRLPKEEIGGWKGEPIFLCDEHSVGHEEIK